MMIRSMIALVVMSMVVVLVMKINVDGGGVGDED